MADTDVLDFSLLIVEGNDYSTKEFAVNNALICISTVILKTVSYTTRRIKMKILQSFHD